MSGIFYHRNTSGSRQESRHVRKLSEQVHGHDRGERAPRAIQRLRINRQEVRVDVDEDRPVAGSYDGAD
jgi:hypothetical protein